jgi:hypothetical protein
MANHTMDAATMAAWPNVMRYKMTALPICATIIPGHQNPEHKFSTIPATGCQMAATKLPDARPPPAMTCLEMLAVPWALAGMLTSSKLTMMNATRFT